jgi:hypothetical protein
MKNNYKKKLDNILTIKNGNSMTEKVSSILDLPISNDWSIIDSKDSLCLVHYSDDADMSQFGHLRGVVVDIDQNRIISPSYFGYNPEAIREKLDKNSEGLVSIIDKDGSIHNFEMDNMYIKPVFDGVVIRVIWYNNKIYFISHSKIDISRSRWGSSTTFMDMYNEAGGPNEDGLFDTSKSESSTCYTFIIVHQLLTVGTRQIVNKPYIVCLSKDQIHNDSPCGKLEFEDFDLEYKIDESFIGKSPFLDLNNANRYLSYGYNHKIELIGDPRSYPGESIIVYSLKNGKVDDIVRVHSPGYEWRKEMRGNNPNIRHQFYKLMSDVYSSDIEYLKNKYMMFDYSNDFIVETVMSGATELTQEIINDNNFLSLICANYIFSLPLNKRIICNNIVNELVNDRKLVINWLKNINNNYKDIYKLENLSYRARTIILMSRQTAKEKGESKTKSGKTLRYNQLANISIYNYMMYEKGESLYSLIREMKKCEEC